MTNRAQWARIEAALDEILALPETQWPEASLRLAGGDTALLAEIKSLLACSGGIDPVLEASLDFSQVPSFWDQWVQLAARRLHLSKEGPAGSVDAGLVRDPVDFPVLAAVVRERLLEMWRFGHHR